MQLVFLFFSYHKVERSNKHKNRKQGTVKIISYLSEVYSSQHA